MERSVSSAPVRSCLSRISLTLVKVQSTYFLALDQNDKVASVYGTTCGKSSGPGSLGSPHGPL